MSNENERDNRVKSFRSRRGWSQDELARRAGISRAAVSAIEIERLVPSVAAALALAEALECRVEDLFGSLTPAQEPAWTWPPPRQPYRFWKAKIRDRIRLIPVEYPASEISLHDGVVEEDRIVARDESRPQETLVMAGCDPAAELAAQAFARQSGFRLLVLQRSSHAALELLRQGLVDVAGLHLAEADDPGANRKAAHERLGDGFSLLSYACWQAGLAVGSGVAGGTVQRVLRSRCRWIGREPGSGARQCQDEVLGRRTPPRRTAANHRAVVDAICGGWADVGVCVRLVCEESGLEFIPIREEAYDLCFPTSLQADPRIRALVQLVRTASFRRALGELPGYRTRSAGDLMAVE
jgi:molybdate-binding protein/DNA-binding XRE family transcriptional regulator